MIRPLFLLLAVAGWVSAQVRQGGVYQITAEILDSGGGSSAAGPYTSRQSLPALGSPAGGGVYALAAGFTGQLGGTGGTGYFTSSQLMSTFFKLIYSSVRLSHLIIFPSGIYTLSFSF